MTVNGDEVVFAEGIYTDDGIRDLDFSGKLITILSKNGPNQAPQAVFSIKRKKIMKRAQDMRKFGVYKVRPFL